MFWITTQGQRAFPGPIVVIGLVFALVGGARSAEAADLCPNATFRVGPSAALPDCRAYELVTPPNMAGLRPYAANYDQSYMQFPSFALSSSGKSLIFHTQGGSLPGFPGNGFTDRYRAVRGPDGWSTELAGPTGGQSPFAYPAGIDLTHSASFTTIKGLGLEGTLAEQFGGDADLLRRSDGGFELIAKGSLGESRGAGGAYISPGASHIIFNSESISIGLFPPPVPLEPSAPPAGTSALYDRSLDGPTHVVSLLPGDATPAAGQNAYFQGASLDGSAVAFRLGTSPTEQKEKALYVRVDNADTYEVSAAAATFAGISAQGEHVFYANAESVGAGSGDQTPADLFSFDTASQTTTQITSVGDAQFANVSEDGSHVYFVSKSPINGEGLAGEPNLYVWERPGDSTTFIATLDPADVAFTQVESGFGDPNMVRWTSQATPEQIQVSNYVGPGKNNSRSTPDGAVFVFQSQAKLTAADNGGHKAIYRYGTIEDTLICVSCRPDETPSEAGSRFQNVYTATGDTQNPVSAPYVVNNVTDDGDAVFFQSSDSLVAADSGPGQDVYRWKAGEVALISSGVGTRDNYLYAVSPDGSDVFFVTDEHLVPGDENIFGAIYSARVNGGFAAASDASGVGPCAGDACQGLPTSAPAPPPLGSATFRGKGNLKTPKRSCGKGKRKVRRAGKVRCVKRKGRQRARSNGRAAR